MTVGHFIQKCSECSKVLAQCRCPDQNKTVELVVCKECADGRTE